MIEIVVSGGEIAETDNRPYTANKDDTNTNGVELEERRVAVMTLCGGQLATNHYLIIPLNLLFIIHLLFHPIRPQLIPIHSRYLINHLLSLFKLVLNGEEAW